MTDLRDSTGADPLSRPNSRHHHGGATRVMPSHVRFCALFIVLVFAGIRPILAQEPILEHRSLEQLGFGPELPEKIDALVQQGLQEKRMPGCVVLVGLDHQIAFAKAYGQRRLDPSPEPMTIDTVFDLASLTKPIA